LVTVCAVMHTISEQQAAGARNARIVRVRNVNVVVCGMYASPLASLAGRRASSGTASIGIYLELLLF